MFGGIEKFTFKVYPVPRLLFSSYTFKTSSNPTLEAIILYTSYLYVECYRLNTHLKFV
jgi:hypothetical protein